MKTNYFITSFFIFVFTLLSISLNAQTNEPVKKVYFDLSLGGMVTGGGLGFNGHTGLGYQFSEFVGMGIGLTYSTDINDLSLNSFSGIGLEYRINKNNLFAKLTSGIVTNYNNPDDFNRYEYIGKKDLFYRFAIGYAPQKGFFNIGLAINSAQGTFDYFYCDFDGTPSLACNYEGVVNENMVSPQLFFGLRFPRLKKRK